MPLIFPEMYQDIFPVSNTSKNRELKNTVAAPLNSLDGSLYDIIIYLRNLPVFYWKYKRLGIFSLVSIL